jgi:hypothetical protein
MEGMMKALVVGVGLAVATILTSFLLVMDSGNSAMAFGAKNVKTYNAQGGALTRHHALTRHQLSVKKQLASNKVRQN